MGEIKVFALTPQAQEKDSMANDPLRKTCTELIDEFINLFEQKEVIKKLKKKIELNCSDYGYTPQEVKLLIKLCEERAKGIYKGEEGDQAQQKLFDLQDEAKMAEKLIKYLPPFKRFGE